MKLIQKLIKDCDKTIDNLEKQGYDTYQIKHNFLRSLLLEVVSSYELEIEELVIERAKKTNDIQVVNFITKSINRSFRSPDLSKIRELLKKFEKPLDDLFEKKVINSPLKQSWDNMMTARHAIVHKAGNLQMTYEEFKQSYPNTTKVVKAIKNILQV